ncbi:MAG: Minf_1886 family protein [Phycisphaerae bacterium]
MPELTPEKLEETIRCDGRYAPEAYEFLHRGLMHSTQMVYGEQPPEGARHVSGAQLCQGLRDLAIRQWGPLALDVLQRWGVRRTRDFGEMVFLLVSVGFLGKQDEDRIEDFDDVYDFSEAFTRYAIVLEE